MTPPPEPAPRGPAQPEPGPGPQRAAGNGSAAGTAARAMHGSGPGSAQGPVGGESAPATPTIPTMADSESSSVIPVVPVGSVGPAGQPGATGGLVDLIRIATFVLDPDGVVVVWSPSAERMTGHSAAQMLGTPVSAIFPPGSAGLGDTLLRQVVGRSGWVGVLPVRREDGRIFDVGFRTWTQHFPGGADLIQVVATDAQDLRRVERNRLAILNSANSRIGTTLEMGQTAAELAEVAVPRFADRIQVRLLDSVQDPSFPVGRQSAEQSIRLRRVAVHAAGHARAMLTDRTRSTVVLPGTPLHDLLLSPRARLVSSASSFGGHSVSSIHIDSGASAVPETHDVPNTHSLQNSDDASATHAAHRIIAPLFARGTLLGLATFTRAADRSAFTGADLEVAEELAARTAICIENGRLYHRERSTALMLQRSLLPERIPQVDGVDVAFRYRPGPVGAEVGGDWFDVIPLPGSRVAFVVGDVMGSGLRAAGTMGQFRTAVRTLAQLDLSPAAILRELDLLAQSMSESHIATCVYVVYDPIACSCLAAAAGHLPPLLVRPDGTVTTLELPVGAPLGVGTNRFHEHEFGVEPGATLVLYTDGLVEDRYQDIDAGIGELAALVGKAGRIQGRPGSLEHLGDLVFQQLSDPHRLDDATLLLAVLNQLPADHLAGWTLSSIPSIAAQARALVREQLTAWHLDDLADTAELLVSELVTNALRYGRGDIGLRLLRAAGNLVCEISDGLESAPRLRTVHFSDEGGRGLYLVDQLSQRWGTRTTDHGKIVWFELPLG
jgi:PAS domain S-box-containing protein